MKKKQKTQMKVQKTLKCVNQFLKTTYNNYIKMKTKIKVIWCIALTISLMCSCNVTRVITNQSEYFQKGDTAVVIQTKTTETYNAERK